LKAILVLEDGATFEGKAFGGPGETTGEVVFNTSMTGYQEILTDPSYRRQIVVMTYVEIGNYGTNPQDEESLKPQVAGFVVREVSPVYSNFRSQISLDEYLLKNNIVGISEVDTRSLTRHIRSLGAMRGIISTEDFDKENLLKKVKNSPLMVGWDLAKEVTCGRPYWWENEDESLEWQKSYFTAEGRPQPNSTFQQLAGPDRPLVVAFDCGIKYNILKNLAGAGFRVKVVPATTTFEEVQQLSPDGIFLSNGPGDPAAVTYLVETVKKLLGKYPIFGICLGHQILGLALGGKTYKLKFGHRGANHPVMNLKTKRISITVQNHGFAVDPDSFSDQQVEITHLNLNDKTVEGLRHKKIQAFAVQYHPECSPGPHDSLNIFDDFKKMLLDFKR
jgi:carbamoyl-phosphate synthase small subunit